MNSATKPSKNLSEVGKAPTHYTIHPRASHSIGVLASRVFADFVFCFNFTRYVILYFRFCCGVLSKENVKAGWRGAEVFKRTPPHIPKLTSTCQRVSTEHFSGVAVFAGGASQFYSAIYFALVVDFD